MEKQRIEQIGIYTGVVQFSQGDYLFEAHQYEPRSYIGPSNLHYGQACGTQELGGISNVLE